MRLPTMMRKASFVLSGLSFLFLVLFALFNRGEVRAQVPMKIEGIPDKGLILVGAADPSFPSMASAILNGRDDLLYRTFQPYSVILWNRTPRTVAMYCLRWEFTRSDGKRVAWSMSYGNQAALLDGPEPRAGKLVNKLSAIIRPNEWMIVTPKSQIGKLSQVTPPGRAAQGANSQDLQNHLEILQSSSDLTISLDGVFFDDGTFVGADRSGFFDRFEAQVSATQDVATEALDGLARGESMDAVMKRLQASVVTPQTALSRSSAPDWYEFFRSQAVSDLQGSRRAFGDEAVMNHARRERFEYPPELRKE